MKRFIKQAATLNGEKMTRLQYDASNGCTGGGGAI